MRQATLADRPAIEAFLNKAPEYAMFPLSNLRTHGMQGGHDRAVRFWLAATGGQITDVLTLTDEGMCMPYLPSGDFDAAARAIAGETIIGLIGPKASARGVELAVGLQSADRSFDHDEPHYMLDLSDLTVPEGQGVLRPLAEAPQGEILDWMRDYQRSALKTPEAEVEGRVAQGYAAVTAAGSHIALMDGDTPLSMTGFNAQLPEIVQIGGVYTPQKLRGKGHARRAVALHLAQARSAGVNRATLFSANASAAAAYEAIGFRRIGDWSLILLVGENHANG